MPTHCLLHSQPVSTPLTLGLTQEAMPPGVFAPVYSIRSFVKLKNF